MIEVNGLPFPLNSDDHLELVEDAKKRYERSVKLTGSLSAASEFLYGEFVLAKKSFNDYANRMIFQRQIENEESK